mmetsp:Transcript_13874/g.30248  ORF Transcript_13874/g.30248 Transcript_13874/m.30248 type:complete len:85 (-) Transcript_13874:73-327(-)
MLDFIVKNNHSAPYRHETREGKVSPNTHIGVTKYLITCEHCYPPSVLTLVGSVSMVDILIGVLLSMQGLSNIFAEQVNVEGMEY